MSVLRRWLVKYSQVKSHLCLYDLGKAYHPTYQEVNKYTGER